MFNHTGIKKETYGSGTQILASTELQYSVGIVVDETCGVTVGSKKIAKAGTPVTGSLDARTTAFLPASAGSDSAASNAIGILLHDVDVTDGNANGALLVFGFVNTNRIDTTTAAKLTSYVKAALNKITFLAC